MFMVRGCINMTGDIKGIIEIVVVLRTYDFRACIKDHPEIWGCGKDYKEAIGDLIFSHSSDTGIKINFDKAKVRYKFYVVTCVNCGFKKFVGAFDMIGQLDNMSKCCKKPKYDTV